MTTYYKILADDFDSKYDRQILYKDRSLYDDCFLKTQVNTNIEFGNYTVKNYRQHFDNCKKEFNTSHELYLEQGVSDGHVGACTIDDSSKITRGIFWSLPIDKLNTYVDHERHMLFLPNQDKHINDVDFFTSTTQPKNPQTEFNPSFEIYGRPTDNYKRKSDKYYKKCKNFDDCNKMSIHGRVY